MSLMPVSTTRQWFLLLGVALSFAVVTDSRAQQQLDLQTLDQRLQRIERILDNRVLLNMVQQLEDMKHEVRQLRGEIESQNHELESMNRRQRDLYLDTDRRLQAMEGGAGGALSGFTLDDLDADDPLLADELAADELLATDDAQLTDEELADSAEQTTPPIAQAPAADEGVIRDEPKEGEKEDYRRAYDILMSGNNQVAVGAFGEFLQQYPRGPYSDNAWYWQGEAKYLARQFDEAIACYDTVIDKFPKSNKVPDARLKKAYALYEKGEFQRAKKDLGAVAYEFRGQSVARLAQKRLEQMAAEGH